MNALRRCLLVLALGALQLPAWGAAESALPGSLPLRRDAEPASDGGFWMPSLLLLGLALAAGGYVAWRRGGSLADRSAGRRADRAITRISSQALTPQASVHAVAWNGEEYLLACTAQQVTLLARRAVDPAKGGAE